jgi:hypothetical protein
MWVHYFFETSHLSLHADWNKKKSTYQPRAEDPLDEVHYSRKSKTMEAIVKWLTAVEAI